MEKLLLHVCCGPCSLGTLEKIRDFDVFLYFTNSNIWPKDEFIKRLSEAKKVSEIYDFKFSSDNWEHDAWKEFISGLENEPERGSRCQKCFEFSLERAFVKAKEMGIKNVTSTLSVSKYKVSKNLFEVGKKLSKKYGLTFLEIDFKKNGGFEKSVKLSKKHNLYMQNYCGCEFSFNKNIASPKEKNR